VDLEWKFTTAGVVVNSYAVAPSVKVTGPGGYSKTMTQGTCGSANECTKFEYSTKDNKWDVHWQPKNCATGTYTVTITVNNGQSFGGYPVVFTK
jgi:hypothetical protein